MPRPSAPAIPDDYARRIKELRNRHGLTQQRLADLLGVSYVTVNRWENEQARPQAIAWQMLTRADQLGI